MTKNPACCARLRARVVQEEGELVRLIRKIHSPRNRNITPGHIAAQKAAVATAKQILSDHEADHAEEAA